MQVIANKVFAKITVKKQMWNSVLLQISLCLVMHSSHLIAAEPLSVSISEDFSRSIPGYLNGHTSLTNTQGCADHH